MDMWCYRFLLCVVERFEARWTISRHECAWHRAHHFSKITEIRGFTAVSQTTAITLTLLLRSVGAVRYSWASIVACIWYVPSFRLYLASSLIDTAANGRLYSTSLSSPSSNSGLVLSVPFRNSLLFVPSSALEWAVSGVWPHPLLLRISQLKPVVWLRASSNKDMP